MQKNFLHLWKRFGGFYVVDPSICSARTISSVNFVAYTGKYENRKVFCLIKMEIFFTFFKAIF